MHRADDFRPRVQSGVYRRIRRFNSGGQRFPGGGARSSSPRERGELLASQILRRVLIPRRTTHQRAMMNRQRAMQHQFFIDAFDASIPAENGSREVEHDPPPLGSEENYSHRRSQTRSDPTADYTSARNDESSARNAASSSIHGVATLVVPRIGVMTRRWPHHRRSANQW